MCVLRVCVCLVCAFSLCVCVGAMARACVGVRMLFKRTPTTGHGKPVRSFLDCVVHNRCANIGTAPTENASTADRQQTPFYSRRRDAVPQRPESSTSIAQQQHDGDCSTRTTLRIDPRTHPRTHQPTRKLARRRHCNLHLPAESADSMACMRTTEHTQRTHTARQEAQWIV